MDTENEVPLVLQLPTEILIEILSRIQHRDDVRLACHRFYEVICLMEFEGGKIAIQDERMVGTTFEAICHDLVSVGRKCQAKNSFLEFFNFIATIISSIPHR